MSGVPIGQSLERRTEIPAPWATTIRRFWAQRRVVSSGKLKLSENPNATSSGRPSYRRTPVRTDPFGKENRIRGLNLKRGSA